MKTVNIYILHKRYSLSPAQIARVIDKYKPDKIIKISGLDLSLTPKGEKWLNKNIRKIFLKPIKYWKEVPPEMQTEKVEINSLYTPHISFFKKKGNCVNKRVPGNSI